MTIVQCRQSSFWAGRAPHGNSCICIAAWCQMLSRDWTDVVIWSTQEIKPVVYREIRNVKRAYSSAVIRFRCLIFELDGKMKDMKKQIEKRRVEKKHVLRKYINRNYVRCFRQCMTYLRGIRLLTCLENVASLTTWNICHDSYQSGKLYGK